MLSKDSGPCSLNGMLPGMLTWMLPGLFTSVNIDPQKCGVVGVHSLWVAFE